MTSVTTNAARMFPIVADNTAITSNAASTRFPNTVRMPATEPNSPRS